MGQGADLAVASLHKMLPSLTQTAVLHATGARLSLPQVVRQAGIFQSSSPSYLLMASMDGCIRLLEEEGEALFAAWKARLDKFDQLASGLKHLRLLGHGAEAGASYPGIFALDPAKILISTRNSALTGVELKNRLREAYKIELEMALDHYAVAMTGLGTDDTMPTRLAEALLALDEGIGKVCGEYIWAYPPGIPLVTPGEEITANLVETVETLYRSGVRLLGTRGKPPFTTFAVADEENQ